jgi:hypothetical protein
MGDVNKDGAVDALDSLWVLFYTSELVGFLPSPELADVDLDGDIDPIDAALILQFHAGFIDGLPAGAGGRAGGWGSALLGRLDAALVKDRATRVR